MQHSNMHYFTYSDLTSAEGGDMQIQRWGTQIDDEKVDQRWREEARKIKGGLKEEREKTNGRGERKGPKYRRPASSAFSTRKVFRLFHEVAYFRSLPPPTGIIERSKDGEANRRS